MDKNTFSLSFSLHMNVYFDSTSTLMYSNNCSGGFKYRKLPPIPDLLKIFTQNVVFMTKSK